MTQSTTHSCVSCGSSVPDAMRFCPNCGTPVAIPQAPPPPPVDAYAPTQRGEPFTAYPQRNNQPAYQPPAAQQGYQPPLQNVQPPPAYARPQKNSSRGMLKGAVILLLLILVLGAAGYFALHALSSRGGTTARTGATSEVTPTQAPLTTTPINTTVTYASVTITIINAQQATSFADDHTTTARGVVRLNLHAVQSDVTSLDFTSAPAYAYGESFALLLPGGNKVALGGTRISAGRPARETRRPGSIFPPLQASK